MHKIDYGFTTEKAIARGIRCVHQLLDDYMGTEPPLKILLDELTERMQNWHPIMREMIGSAAHDQLIREFYAMAE